MERLKDRDLLSALVLFSIGAVSLSQAGRPGEASRVFL
jgi:hypothetical protein